MSVIKRSALWISVLILLVFCMSAFLMPKNAKATEIVMPEIENASFEGLEPFGWEISAENIDAQNHGITNQPFYDGTSSYELKSNQYVIKSEQFIAIDLDSEYVVGFKYFSSETANTCKLSVEVYDQNDQMLYVADGETIDTQNLNVWQDVRLNFLSTENASKIKINIQVNVASGKVCIDKAYCNKNFVHTLSGASINLETSPSAMDGKGQIRFTGKIDKSAYDEFLSAYSGASVGFMLIPTDHLSQIGEFTHKGIEDAGRTQSLRVLMVDKWTNFYTVIEDGFYSLDCAIRGMSGQSIKANISVRIFIKYYQDGMQKYLYSDYNQEDNSRSVYQVALMAKEDVENFAHYSPAQQEKINAYIEGREPNIENLD